MAEISSVGASNAALATAVGNDGATAPVNEVSTEATKAETANAVTEAVGNAVKGAAEQLHQQNGMPKFLVDDIKQIVANAVKSLKQEGSFYRNQFNVLDKFTANLTQQIVDSVNNSMQEQTGGAKKGGGSWMQAIAKAMGEVMGKKAARMVELSDKIATLAEPPKPADGTAVTKTNEQVQNEKMEAASKTQTLNTEFQATGQEFNLLQTTFSTAIKTIGEGMASIARKQ